MATANALLERDPMEIDAAVYGNHLNDLLSQDRGKFAVVGQGQLLGVYGSYEEALKAGYAKFKLGPFLVKRIEPIENERSDFHVACQS